jgi:hypothetical protein
MKSIPLRTLDAPDNSPPIIYSDVLREVVRRPLNTQAGIQIAEMRQSLRVLDAIDASNGTLELEDADYTLLKEKINAMPWSMADRRIIELVDDVNNASS